MHAGRSPHHFSSRGVECISQLPDAARASSLPPSLCHHVHSRPLLPLPRVSPSASDKYERALERALEFLRHPQCALAASCQCAYACAWYLDTLSGRVAAAALLYATRLARRFLPPRRYQATMVHSCLLPHWSSRHHVCRDPVDQRAALPTYPYHHNLLVCLCVACTGRPSRYLLRKSNFGHVHGMGDVVVCAHRSQSHDVPRCSS
mmetsp:Transcript_13139/g.39958  ORF Transcript_13139/g.39958 Transcript_13139/m.39958 type:complete len:205 (-) Transcript_13139:1415-2029(-)